MLPVQEFLQNNGLQKLEEQYAIRSTHHPTLPLVILNYTQGRSQPKDHPIVRNCRALVLEKDSWKVVGKSFDRFFNYGEIQSDLEKFDWSNFEVQEKVDGSLMNLFNYQGTWMVTTRASFADGKICPSMTDKTWSEVFFDSIHLTSFMNNSTWTYAFELCSPFNKIVKSYETPQLYLLAAFDNDSSDELGSLYSQYRAEEMQIQHLKIYPMKSVLEIQSYLNDDSLDKTFEGFVIKDRNNNRIKMKNDDYVMLSRMKGPDGNLFHTRNLLPWVLANDEAELLIYYPEAKPMIDGIRDILQRNYSNLEQLWLKTKDISNQKEFALAIKDYPLSSILFTCRKSGGDLEKTWKESEDYIAKRVFDL
jgi:hypothetical protein